LKFEIVNELSLFESTIFIEGAMIIQSCIVFRFKLINETLCVWRHTPVSWCKNFHTIHITTAQGWLLDRSW